MRDRTGCAGLRGRPEYWYSGRERLEGWAACVEGVEGVEGGEAGERRAGKGYGEEEGIGRESNNAFPSFDFLPQPNHVRRVPTATASVPRGLKLTRPHALQKLSSSTVHTSGRNK